jgi:hypothetical protein
MLILVESDYHPPVALSACSAFCLSGRQLLAILPLPSQVFDCHEQSVTIDDKGGVFCLWDGDSRRESRLDKDKLHLARPGRRADVNSFEARAFGGFRW